MQIILLSTVGSILATLISRFILHGAPTILIPWGIIGLVLGYLGQTQKKALIAGAIYGFIISFAFMTLGYTGAAPLVTRVPFFAVLGLFGAVCGMIFSAVGFILKSRVKLK